MSAKEDIHAISLALREELASRHDWPDTNNAKKRIVVALKALNRIENKLKERATGHE